jgi:hypothetical protein
MSESEHQPLNNPKAEIPHDKPEGDYSIIESSRELEEATGAPRGESLAEAPSPKLSVETARDQVDDLSETMGRVSQVIVIGELAGGVVTITSLESVTGEGESKQALQFSVEEPVLNSLQHHTDHFPNVKAAYNHLSMVLHKNAMVVKT